MIIVPYTCMVEMVYTFAGTRCENVFHVTTPLAPTPANLVSIANVFRTWHWDPATSTGLRSLQHNNAILVLIKVTSLHAIGAPFYELAVTTNNTGIKTAGNTSAMVTLVVKWSTGLAGRSFRGRTYHIGLNLRDIDATTGLIGAGEAALYVTRYSALISMLNTAGFPLVIASKYSGVDLSGRHPRAIPRAVGITTPVLTCSCERGPDTNRHRKLAHYV